MAAAALGIYREKCETLSILHNESFIGAFPFGKAFSITYRKG